MIRYKSHLKKPARNLRKTPNESEQVLWSRLRRKQLLGVQFYRQKPIGHIIVDFYAPQAKLVIEVDGSQHLEEDQAERDRYRDEYLAGAGLRVLRYHSNEVLTRTESVVEAVYQAIAESLGGKIPPIPPFPKGGTDKERLDQLVVSRGLADTRARAQALILAGRVRVDGQLVAKAGTLVAGDVIVEVTAPASPYVSRGGEKLAGALDHFGVDPAGLICLDAGASTGGFSQVLLLRGGARVYAVDVGYGQLDPVVRNDPRVVVLERVNIRLMPREAIPEPVDLATLDLSFISLTLVIPKILEFLKTGGAILALVKPQFEVGKGRVGKGGVVRDVSLQQEAVARVADAARSLGLAVSDPFPSPLKGPKGNQEWFLHLQVP